MRECDREGESGRPIGVGIVGFGSIGQVHAVALEQCPAARVVAVARRHRDEAVAARFPRVAWYTDYRALLRRDDIAVVAICTPNGDHAKQTLDALAAGKHVVVEKPLALSLADGERVVDEARTRGRLLAVMSQRRLEPQNRYLKALLDAGTLGTPVLGEALVRWYRDRRYYDSAPWRGSRALDGGVLPNQAIHAIDLLRWFLGPVESVTGFAASRARYTEAADTGVAALRFASGALGVIAATAVAPPGLPAEVNLFFARGQVAIHDAAVARWEVPDVPPPPGEAVGSGRSDPAAIGILGHLRQWRDILAALRERRDPLVTGVDGLATLAVILAIEESDRTGQLVHLHQSRRERLTSRFGGTPHGREHGNARGSLA